MPELNRMYKLLKKSGEELAELVGAFEDTIVAEGTAKLRGLEADNNLVPWASFVVQPEPGSRSPTVLTHSPLTRSDAGELHGRGWRGALALHSVCHHGL